MKEYMKNEHDKAVLAETVKNNAATQTGNAETRTQTAKNQNDIRDISRGQLAVSQGHLAETRRVNSVTEKANAAANTPEALAAAQNKPGKPLPNSVLSQAQEARDNAASIESLESSFKPKFAGKGVIGIGSNLQLSASEVLGADSESVDWWKNYRKQAELVERHSLFGASLTQNEQAAWRAADISPGSAASVIQKNLATRKRLTKKVLENTTADLIDAGHDEKRIKAITGRAGAAAPADAAKAINFSDLK
jgi:hypothetical protein